MGSWEVYVTSVAAVIVTVVNFSCIFLIFRTRLLRLTSNVALCGLLFSHLLQGLLVMPLYAVKRAEMKTNPHYTKLLCDGFRFSYLVTNYGSCLCLLLLTVDRVISARFPLYYHVHLGWKTVAAALLAVWVYVTVLCTIPFMHGNERTKYSCSYRPQKEWVLFMLVAHTLCPFLIVLLSYVYVFKKVQSLFKRDTFVQYDLKELSNETSSDGGRNRSRFLTMRTVKEQWNAAITSFVIVVCYILCWGPSFVYYFIEAVCPECYSQQYLQSDMANHVSFLIKFFTFLDGLLAPLIYCAKNKAFREMFFRQARSFSLTQYTTD